MAPDQVLHKDVVTALLGASATIAGLVLVFVGLVVAAYDALGPAVPADAKRPLRRTLWVLSLPFVLSLVQILAAASWFLTQWGWLYQATVSLFIATVITLFVAAGWSLRRVLWG